MPWKCLQWSSEPSCHGLVLKMGDRALMSFLLRPTLTSSHWAEGTKGYQRIPEDTSTIHAMDGPAFLAFPLLSILTSLHWRGGLGQQKDTRGYQKIPEHTNFLELFEMGGPAVLAFLLLPILTSSSKEPTPQFHQSSPFVALGQVFPITNVNIEFEKLEEIGKGSWLNKDGNISIYTIRDAPLSKKCSFFEHCSNGGGVNPCSKIMSEIVVCSGGHLTTWNLHEKGLLRHWWWNLGVK